MWTYPIPQHKRILYLNNIQDRRQPHSHQYSIQHDLNTLINRLIHTLYNLQPIQEETRERDKTVIRRHNGDGRVIRVTVYEVLEESGQRERRDK